ncbi:site-specific integrase [Peribacillus sp. NPDC097206]|uniref:site-specific integrase n=1 Tax=unclassified Peribacillus TaxID=2675266 RepID=UPI0037FE6F09
MASFHKYKKKGSNKNFWEYRIVYKDSITQKFKEKSKKGFTGKSEAKLAAEEAERLIREGYNQTDESLKLYLHTWLEEYKKGLVAKNTLELHEQNIKNHIIPYFKNVLLKDVRPILYQKFINQLAEKDYSRRTIEIIHQTMFNSFEKAIVLEKVKKNPCAGVEIRGEKKKREIQFIESEHIAEFLQIAYKYDYTYWLFYKALIETGLRKGEAAALQWTDINLKEKTININKSLGFKEASKDKSKIFGDTKNFSSKHIITISHGFAIDLSFHKKYKK